MLFMRKLRSETSYKGIDYLKESGNKLRSMSSLIPFEDEQSEVFNQLVKHYKAILSLVRDRLQQGGVDQDTFQSG